MAVVETSGLSDRILYSQVMTNLGRAYEQYGVGDGNFPNVEDILTDRILYNVWMRNNLNARIFVDGMGITSRTAQDAKASSVRVPIMMPPRYKPRTITIGQYPGGSIQGTPGNDGLENRNLPQTPQTNGVEVPFNQVYDDACVIYELSQDMLSLPIAAQFTSMIPGTVANMQDSTIMATQIKGGLYQATQNGNGNIVAVDPDNTDEGYLQGIMNAIIGLMTNPATTWAEGVVQYDLERSVIIMKQSLFNLLFTVKNGVLVQSNLAQEMLVRGAFTDDGRPKGNLIRGMYSGVYIKVVPDSYWRQAAAYAGIKGEQFAQWDKVLAYIANADGTAFGVASTTINPIPNPGNAVGTKIQNLWRWGCGVVRPSAIGLVVSSKSAALDDFVNPVNEQGNIIAPESFDEIIRSYGIKTDYGSAQRVGVYDDKTTTTVTLTVTGTDSAEVSDAALKITSGGKPVGYINNANGTYTFVLGRKATASVEITANGYTPATINVTEANTAGATYAVTQALTAVAPARARAAAKASEAVKSTDTE